VKATLLDGLVLLLALALLFLLAAGCAPTLRGQRGESTEHFKARLIVRACAFVDSELAILRTTEALEACDDEACEFAICTQLRAKTSTCDRGTPSAWRRPLHDYDSLRIGPPRRRSRRARA